MTNESSQEQGEPKDSTAPPMSWLPPAILLALREQDAYGYELMQRTADFGGLEWANPGMLYRTLRQMEKQGLVESRWDTLKGTPARRMYSITDNGETYLHSWIEVLENQWRNMNLFRSQYRKSLGIEPSEPWPEIDQESIPRGGG